MVVATFVVPKLICGRKHNPQRVIKLFFSVVPDEVSFTRLWLSSVF